MFSPGNVVYAFCNDTNPPKYKYMISLYRGVDFDIIFCYTTSKNRAGVPEGQIHHGGIKNGNGDYVSYVFEAGVTVGTSPNGSRFAFPKRSTVTFDYGLLITKTDKLLASISEPEVKCHLDDKEYIDLVYAIKRSPLTPEKFKPYLESVLEKFFSRK